MDKAEYSGVVRSFALKFLVSLIGAGVGVYGSLKDYIDFDVYTCALLGFFFVFCMGGKVFTESSKFISRRARNYRRAKKGLEPLDVEDEPTPEIITDFQRRG